LETRPVAIRATAGRYVFAAARSSATAVSVARFGSTYGHAGDGSAGHSEAIMVPADRASLVPWRMMLTGADGVVCAS
jgi:hypothetical protein